MNTRTQQDRTLADTLRDLSAVPVPAPAAAPSRAPRRWAVGLTCALLGVGTVATVLWPDIARRVLGPLPSSRAAPAPQMAEPQPSDTPPPLTAPVAFEITGSGYVVAPDTTVVYGAQGGQITQILVQPGDAVAAGQPLLRIDDSETRFAVQDARLVHQSADLALSAARISRDQADAHLRRQTELTRRGAVAGQWLEDAQTASWLARNRVEQAEAARDTARLALRMAEARVADLTVRAPIDGTVTRVAAHVGDAVLDRSDAIHDGVGLLTIARLDTLVIEADVAEKALGTLRPGLLGEAVLDAFPVQPFAVALHRIAPSVNAARGTVALRLTPITPPQDLRPGMAARIRIALPTTTPPTDQTGDPLQ